MAIADAEPKKGDVDVTSTGSSSGSAETKKLPLGPVKYSSLKDFSFSVSDVWDDKNICIFLDCCHANIDGLKSCSGSEENKVWEKIARSGLERSGSINCFNVNDCLELARCLKSFVTKNEVKMTDNDIFKALFDNVGILLPYFAPVSRPRLRSRSKSTEKGDRTSSFSDSGLLAQMRPKQLTSDPVINPQHAIQVMAKVMSKYKAEDFVRTTSRNAIWREVSASVESEFGVIVNPKNFLEGFKSSILTSVRRHMNPAERAKVFLELTGDLLPFFDLVAPKSIKKAEFLMIPSDPGTSDPATSYSATSDPATLKPHGKKRKNGSVDAVDDSSEEYSARFKNTTKSPKDCSPAEPFSPNTPVKKRKSDSVDGVEASSDDSSAIIFKTPAKSVEDNSSADTPNLPADASPTSFAVEESAALEAVPVELNPPPPSAVSEESAVPVGESVTEEPPVVEQTPAAKRRGRKPKTAEQRAMPPKKLLPSRQSSRHKKPDISTQENGPETGQLAATPDYLPRVETPRLVTSDNQQKTPTKSDGLCERPLELEPAKAQSGVPAADTPLISGKSQVVAVAQSRKSPVDSQEVATADSAQAMTATDAPHSVVPAVSSRALAVRTTHPARAICYENNDRCSSERRDSSQVSDSDSEIEDIPLMGTNIRVHMTKGTVESKTSFAGSDMNPVVLLDKTSADSYLSMTSLARSRPVRRTQSKWRRPQTSLERTSPGEKTPRKRATPTLFTPPGGVRRRPGRPPKTSPVTPNPTSSHHAIEDTSRSSRHFQFVTPAQHNRARTYSRQYSSQLSVVNRNLETLPLQRRDEPPKWFTDFIIENRRHEMWKMHQLFKIQSEIMSVEHEKRDVLEKILVALRGRP